MNKRWCALWAKSPPKETSHLPHPVIAHLLDVAASTWTILQREPQSTTEAYAQDLGMAPEDVLPFVCALAGLHDIGKVSPTFQKKWDVGRDILFAADGAFNWNNNNVGAPGDEPHNVVSQAVLPGLLQAQGLTVTYLEQLADAVGCHHGFRTDAQSLGRAGNDINCGRGIWDEARHAITAAVFDTLGVKSLPTSDTFSAAAQMRLAGLTSFADWIGSSFYPEIEFNREAIDLGAYYNRAKDLAEARLDEYGWTPRTPLRTDGPTMAETFHYLSPTDGFTPRPLQEAVVKLLEDTHAPTLLLIEAPMGEGKTEAAFYAHIQLQAALKHRGLYVALPTMATGNMMFSRTRDFLNNQRPERDYPVDLQLLHGAALLNEDYQALQQKILPNTQTENDREDIVVARSYFSQRRKALLSEYGVGTVDQLLLAILNVKWHFIRLWGIANRVVVIDEVHAYDTYTSGLIVTLVRWLMALGSSLIIMSATLPQDKRRELLQAFGGEDVATEAYPRTFKVSAGKTELQTFSADPGRALTLTLRHIEDNLGTIAKTLNAELAEGGCAVAIVNTVDRAQKLFQLLAAQGTDAELFLFHARYPAEERSKIEDSVLATFGKDGKRPRKAILVATQVVEQSLDLDFDLMVSDLSPIDLLLQRAGRLWRHKRDAASRGVKEPTLYVSYSLTEDQVPNLAENFWDKIYEPLILFRTWDYLKDKNHIHMPDDIDPFVQAVYASDYKFPDGLPSNAKLLFEASYFAYKSNQELDLHDANNAGINRPINNPKRPLALREVDNVYQMSEEPGEGRKVALTRKASPSLSVIPLYTDGKRYYYDAEKKHLYRDKEPLRAYRRILKLSRKGVVGDKPESNSPLSTDNKSTGVSSAFKHWKKEPLLSHCEPLILNEAGEMQLGRLTLRLDETLGLVYEYLAKK